jgi:protein involved in polysaccharide export with SLBB domain
MTSIVSRCAWWLAIDARLRCLALACLALFAAAPGARAQLTESYRIQPTDILVIEVVNEPKIGIKELRVTASGEISYPFIGAVKVVEMSPAAVQAKIKELLEADYLVNAQVIVQIKEFRKRYVSVIGQVNRPGPVEIPAERRLTVIEVISFAGGLTRLARSNDIQLTRAGRTEPMRLSLEELTRNPDKPVYVETGDVINVPESRI